MTPPDLSGEVRFSVVELAVLRIERALSVALGFALPSVAYVLAVGMVVILVLLALTAGRGSFRARPVSAQEVTALPSPAEDRGQGRAAA